MFKNLNIKNHMTMMNTYYYLKHAKDINLSVFYVIYKRFKTYSGEF